MLLLTVVLTWALVLAQEDDRTPLDDYIDRPEPAYGWEVVSEYRTEDDDPDKRYTSYVLNVTSQVWMDEDTTNQPLWWHYLIIVVPDVLRYDDAAFMTIDNGNLADSEPTPEGDGRMNTTRDYALGLQAVAADLKLIPNQRLHCATDPPDRWRREDDLISWTWRQFVDDPISEEILLQLPMTKGAVKAMDAIQEFANDHHGLNIEEFMLNGGSKRGWTAFLAGAVDDRVFAMSPSVLTCLNFTEVMHHQYEAYGGWSFTNKDYWLEGLMADIDHPNTHLMMETIDPYVYRNRLTMPKLITVGTGDEHFMPDDSWYFWEGMTGPSYIWMLEESGHSLGSSKHGWKLAPNRMAFFHSVKQGFALPQLEWQRGEDREESFGWITLTTDTEPLNITAVYGDTNTADRRDFRITIGIPDPTNPVGNPIDFHEGPVEDLGNGEYRVTYDFPEEGWRCFLIKMEFQGPNDSVLYFTTETNIIPDYLPYPRCSDTGNCQGILL